MNFSNYPILRLLIPYIFGIILGNSNVLLPVKPLFLIVIMVVIWLFCLILFPKLSYNYQRFMGIVLFFCFICIGFLSMRIRYDPTNDIHTSSSHEPDNYILKIIDNPQEKTNSIKSICLIECNIDGKFIGEKAVVYFQKSVKATTLQFGDVILVHAIFSEIAPPQNPYTFDYRKYMNKRDIYYTAYITENRFTIIDHCSVRSLRQSAYRLQHYFSSLLARSGLEGDEYSIITAILLGNDETMDSSLRASYTSAGVNHILCVSGMHVGIIFMILNFLLKPLNLNRKTKTVKALILISCVWGYAHITGLSPSVQRASVMFTFVVFGNLLQRNTNVFHSLFASLFILLSINPLLLFEVGFQLSYLAVFGIVIFQKPIASLWKPKKRIVTYFWELTSVSVSAQLGTFPIAVYYFGQFPNYFLVANLSVIMLSMIIVITGIIVLILSFSPLLASWAGKVLCYEIKGMNTIIAFIDQLPGSVTTDISYNIIQVFLLYIAIFSIYLLFSQKRKKYYWIALPALTLFSILFVFRSVSLSLESSITIYSIPKNMAINFNSHGKSILLNDFIESKEDRDYQYSIINHERKKRMKSHLMTKEEDVYDSEISFFKEGDFIYFRGVSLCILPYDSKVHTLNSKLQVDYLYLYRQPKIKPEEVKNIFDFKCLIIGRTVSPYYENQWTAFCKKENIVYHSLNESGAMIVNLPR